MSEQRRHCHYEDNLCSRFYDKVSWWIRPLVYFILLPFRVLTCTARARVQLGIQNKRRDQNSKERPRILLLPLSLSLSLSNVIPARVLLSVNQIYICTSLRICLSNVLLASGVLTTNSSKISQFSFCTKRPLASDAMTFPTWSWTLKTTRVFSLLTFLLFHPCIVKFRIQ